MELDSVQIKAALKEAQKALSELQGAAAVRFMRDCLFCILCHGINQLLNDLLPWRESGSDSAKESVVSDDPLEAAAATAKVCSCIMMLRETKLSL